MQFAYKFPGRKATKKWLCVNYEILFAMKRKINYLGSKITSDCCILGVDEFFVSPKIVDFILNTSTSLLVSKSIFSRISFHSKFTFLPSHLEALSAYAFVHCNGN